MQPTHSTPPANDLPVLSPDEERYLADFLLQFGLVESDPALQCGQHQPSLLEGDQSVETNLNVPIDNHCTASDILPEKSDSKSSQPPLHVDPAEFFTKDCLLIAKMRAKSPYWLGKSDKSEESETDEAAQGPSASGSGSSSSSSLAPGPTPGPTPGLSLSSGSSSSSHPSPSSSSHSSPLSPPIAPLSSSSPSSSEDASVEAEAKAEAKPKVKGKAKQLSPLTTESCLLFRFPQANPQGSPNVSTDKDFDLQRSSKKRSSKEVDEMDDGTVVRKTWTRTRMACNYCRHRKIKASFEPKFCNTEVIDCADAVQFKCDGNALGCSACTQRHQQCIYSAASRPERAQPEASGPLPVRQDAPEDPFSGAFTQMYLPYPTPATRNQELPSEVSFPAGWSVAQNKTEAAPNQDADYLTNALGLYLG